MQEKRKGCTLIFIGSLIIPIVGLIYCLLVRGKEKERARASLYGSLLGAFLWIVISLIGR